MRISESGLGQTDADAALRDLLAPPAPVPAPSLAARATAAQSDLDANVKREKFADAAAILPVATLKAMLAAAKAGKGFALKVIWRGDTKSDDITASGLKMVVPVIEAEIKRRGGREPKELAKVVGMTGGPAKITKITPSATPAVAPVPQSKVTALTPAMPAAVMPSTPAAAVAVTEKKSIFASPVYWTVVAAAAIGLLWFVSRRRSGAQAVAAVPTIEGDFGLDGIGATLEEKMRRPKGSRRMTPKQKRKLAAKKAARTRELNRKHGKKKRGMQSL